MDWSAQYAAGDKFVGYTGYQTHGPCTGFEGNGIMIYFDTFANAQAAWQDKNGTTRHYGGQDFYITSVDGIEVFFRWS